MFAPEIAELEMLLAVHLGSLTVHPGSLAVHVGQISVHLAPLTVHPSELAVHPKRLAVHPNEITVHPGEISSAEMRLSALVRSARIASAPLKRHQLERKDPVQQPCQPKQGDYDIHACLQFASPPKASESVQNGPQHENDGQLPRFHADVEKQQR